MIKKINPFVEARYRIGFKKYSEVAKAINMNDGKLWQWEHGRNAFIKAGKSGLDFQKLCEFYGWSKAQGEENLSNIYQWTKNPDIEVVDPDWDECQKNPIKKEEHINVESNPLKIWRNSKGMSTSEAAKMIGIDINVYSDCEMGIKKPDGFALGKIINRTGLSFRDIQKIFKDIKDDSIVEIEDHFGNVYDDILEPDSNEPTVIAIPTTIEGEEITEHDENNKPVAGRYPWTLTEEEVDMYDTMYNTMEDPDKAEALNEPHDFRDEVIDEVLEKMYGQMDYKKYVYLVGLLGR